MNFLRELLDYEPQPWAGAALCHQVGPDMGDAWFPNSGDQAPGAKAVCGRCPVRDECLQYALDLNIKEGIWGGLNERERRKLRREGAAA